MPAVSGPPEALTGAWRFPATLSVQLEKETPPMHKLILALSLILGLEGIARANVLNWLPPDEQAKLRAERSFTIGVPVVEPYNLPGHFQWRPSASFTLGAGYDASLHESNTRQLRDDYTLNAHQHSWTLYAHYSPLEKSGFHLGLGVESRFGTFTMEHGPEHALAARGHYQGLYAGPAIGWTWIWTNGITFGFDVTKRKRFKGEATLTTAVPDPTAMLMPDTVAGTFMLGYSL
jgi:hypothetical protein